MKHTLLLLLVALPCLAQSQAERKSIRDGNSQFETHNFPQAELYYNRALERNPSSFEALFNRADALYKQGKYEDAAKEFEGLAATSEEPAMQADALHNLGNTYMQSQQYQKAVDAYRNALRAELDRPDTRYNMAYALQKLQEQQQQQNKQNQNNKDNQDEQQQQDQQQQDQQDQQNKQQEQQDKQQQQQQDQQQQEQQQSKQNQQQQPANLSKEAAQQMYEALKSKEKDTHERIERKKATGKKRRSEKEW